MQYWRSEFHCQITHQIYHSSLNYLQITEASAVTDLSQIKVEQQQQQEKGEPLKFYSVSIYVIGGPINPIALPSTEHQEFLSRVYVDLEEKTDSSHGPAKARQKAPNLKMKNYETWY